ncbi:hypothetical protein BV25DRAFT_1916290 [Artomyces pyxidatus]|uniref:Uncharacterized protein n=1 Tax=Artomyces pyxidatus TaxID=48021 RepID=A0ACB8SZV8_9AGAM|nr:hypothetical protein BV25DRAFT_1916290 [Artomyces pyxidatus]
MVSRAPSVENEDAPANTAVLSNNEQVKTVLTGSFEGVPVTFTGRATQVPANSDILPLDIRTQLKSVTMKNVLVVRRRTRSGLEYLNGSSTRTVAVTIFDPWQPSNVMGNPVRGHMVMVSPTLVLPVTGDLPNEMACARRGNCLRKIREMLGDVPAELEHNDFHHIRVWLRDRAVVWSAMYIAGNVRAKYRKVSESPELLAYKAQPRSTPFETPSRLRVIDYKTRRTVERVKMAKLSDAEYRVELAQAVRSRLKLGLMDEMEADVDESDGEGSGDEARLVHSPEV